MKYWLPLISWNLHCGCYSQWNCDGPPAIRFRWCCGRSFNWDYWEHWASFSLCWPVLHSSLCDVSSSSHPVINTPANWIAFIVFRKKSKPENPQETEQLDKQGDKKNSNFQIELGTQGFQTLRCSCTQPFYAYLLFWIFIFIYV